MRAIWPGALLAAYLTATLGVLLVGHGRVGAGGLAAHLVLLGVVSAATWWNAVPQWLRRWVPLIALLFLYSELPMLIRAAGGTTYFDALVVDGEQLVFSSQPARTWATRAPYRAVSETLHLAYLSYYAIIFCVPLFLFRAKRDAEFSEAVFALMLTFVVCFAVYIVFPVAGPRYHWEWSGKAMEGPARQFVLWVLESRSSRGTAFPSSHVAVSVAQSILAVRYFGWRGLAVGLLTIGLSLGAIYGGFHYALDVLAGVVTGVVTSVLGLLIFRLATARQRADAKAIAPT